jgi:hypothetical protein
MFSRHLTLGSYDMRRACLILATVALAVFMDMPRAAAERRPQLQVGTLTCRLAPTVGLIAGSRQRGNCRFVRRDGRIEHYTTSITRFGLDLGVTAGGIMQWRVLARARTVPRGTIAGHYVGAGGSVSVGAGVGAKALIGGSRRSTMLQPLSFSANVGVNLAFGVTGLTLRHKPLER